MGGDARMSSCNSGTSVSSTATSRRCSRSRSSVEEAPRTSPASAPTEAASPRCSGAIAGVYRPGLGQVLFRATRFDHVPAHKRVGNGHRQVLRGPPRLPSRRSSRTCRWGLRRPLGRLETSSRCCAFPLAQAAAQAPGPRRFSGGEQQALAIGRALMSNRTCCCSTRCRSASRRWSSSASTRP